MLIFLYGKDTFRGRECLHKMIAKFKTDRDPSGYNVLRFDALAEKPGTILTELYNSPFLAEKRMVIVEHSLESKYPELHEKIEAVVGDENILPSSTICILYERTDSYKTKVSKELVKKLAKTKYAQHFEVLEGTELRQWISGHAKDLGLVFERNILEYIALNSKGDTWFLHSLIEQLAAYTKGKSCTIETVRLFLDEVADDNIFNLIDAIVQKKPEQVYAMIREQYEAGQEAGYIFAMMVRQFRIMLQIKDVLVSQPGTPPDTIAKMLSLHPFVVKKTISLVRGYSMEEIKDIFHNLLSIDIKTKTGKGSLPVMIDMLVGKICVR